MFNGVDKSFESSHEPCKCDFCLTNAAHLDEKGK